VERRDFLTRVGAGLAFAWQRSASGQSPSFTADVELELRAAPGSASIVPGSQTRVWRYQARLLTGPQGTVQPVADTYLGPILRLQAGQRVRVHFINDLPEASIVHWHGLDVPTQADGHPRLAVATGRRYVYEFEVTNRAGTYWYHPHPHMRTAYQTYHGLTGLIVVSDPGEAALRLPSGSDELVWVLQDRQLDAGNQLVYVSGMMMDTMNGFTGDRVLMNGSNSRVYKLAWSPSMPITVIGTDGGLLEKPVTRGYVTLAPGERVDTILDLTGTPVGSRLTLRSLEFPSRMFAMQMGMGGMRGPGMGRGRGRGGMGRGSTLPQGAPIDVMTVTVDRRESSSFRLPAALSTYDAAWRTPANAPTRVIKISFQHMQFLLDGRTFDMQDVAASETVQAGSTHIWEFDNSGPAMMNMRLGHPIHLHGRQFRVLKRTVEAARQADWQTLKDGFVDEGWKDTALVLPGERVQLLVKFSTYPGLYLYHCHNLEHEDMGMMRNFRIM
jgi:FtsP/CotA-like multicopper oxidase with cupredoxin domain